MWRIEHRCSPEAPSSHFAVQRSGSSTHPLTRVACPNPLCREYFLVMGDQFFKEAVSTEGMNFPPGFLIPRSRTLT